MVTPPSGPDPRRPSPVPAHPAGGSIFESFDGVAHLLRQPGAADGADPGVVVGGGPAIPSAAAARSPALPQPDAAVFRPTLRRPMALLHVVDDGREDGEAVRMRGDTLRIGRNEGDVQIPHDISMSSAHAMLERVPEGGWRLSDLGSATGTFVRVTRAPLKHGSMLMIGMTRLRFDIIDMTEAWLVEMPLHGQGRRHECHGPAATVGRAPDGCQVVIDDPFVSPIHARVFRSQRGWRIKNFGMNGLWVRIDAPVTFTATAQFQCGEQRFVFMPLA